MARRTSQIHSNELSRDSISAGCTHGWIWEQVTHLLRKPEHESREEVNELNPSSAMIYFAAVCGSLTSKPQTAKTACDCVS